MNGSISIVSNAIARTLSTKGADYLARPAGSSVDGLDVSDGAAVASFLLSHVWEDVTDEASAMGLRFGSCRYFRAEIAEGYVGREAIALLSEISDEDLANVRVLRGHHGSLELQLAGQAPRVTGIMYLILGSYQAFPNGEVTSDTAGVVTWYPGRLKKPTDLTDATVKFTR